MEQDGGILAHGIEHHRIAETGGHLAKHMDRFGFKTVEMGEGHAHSTIFLI